MIRRFFYSLHRFLGSIICLLLTMWFITGLVLIYHPFPNVSNELKYANMEAISSESDLPNITSLVSEISRENKIKIITINQFDGQLLFHLQTDKKQNCFPADSTERIKPITTSTINNIAKRWSNNSIIKIDTLEDRDIWIMYNKYIKELPIYKIHFNDNEKHQLYISSHTGEVQQFTSFDERVWAYIGAIPHKLYIPALRKNTGLWVQTVTVLSVICLFVALSGLYIGIDASIRRYRRTKKIECLYRKRIYRWHHILGIIFSLFLITWSISGIISLRKTPQWITKTHEPIPMGIKGKPIDFDKYILDYRDILNQYENVKEIEWSYFQGRPLYNVTIGYNQLVFDASTHEIKELNLDEQDIEKMVRYNHGEIDYSMELIDNYEDYYLPWRKELALPVYKVSVFDEDNSIYYINPKKGEYKYLNENRKTRKWLFFGLHYFHIKWLVDRPLLWTITIWVLTLGCTIVSLTGVWLGGRYFKRKIKKN